MDRFDAAVQIIIGAEGAWSNDHEDTGGETAFGHDQASWPDTLRRMLPDTRALMPRFVRDLTYELAVQAYYDAYWNYCRCDDMPAPLALLVFDATVNQGQGWAPVAFQRIVGASPDGDIGPETLAKANSCNVLEAIGEFIWMRDERYRTAWNWHTYGHGWIKRLGRVAALSTVYSEPAVQAEWLPHLGKMR